jgi:valyl-tRNA synthetase
MDTWATSSVSPQIVSGWLDDQDLFEQLFPMDMRPQGHDIIRTWLFSSVVRAHYLHGSVPWKHAAISGWVLDPDRKKMSKSKGNVVTPMGMLEEYGSDAVRYWAANGRPGADTAFDVGQMKQGRRLATKILNASRFVLSMEAQPGPVSEPLDRAMLRSLAGVVGPATKALDGYDHARALDLVERFFWGFTDDYVELVKQRAYGTYGSEAAASAVGALRIALDVLLRLFAPFLPYVTEEVWSWWRDGSVHRAPWPTVDDLSLGADGDPLVYDVASSVLSAVRREKALQKASLRAPVERVVVHDVADRLAALALAERDVVEAGSIASLETANAEESSIETVLVSSPAG